MRSLLLLSALAATACQLPEATCALEAGGSYAGADAENPADLTGLACAGAALGAVDLSFTRLEGGDFDEADLAGANLTGAYAGYAWFREATLPGATLDGADVTFADFERADLSDATVAGADVRSADFTHADLSGVAGRVFGMGVTLYGADLTGADLTSSLLIGADARLADFSGAVLHGVDLRGARLNGADFTGADLTGAWLGDDEVLNHADIHWDDTTCPDGSHSADHGGTCEGWLEPFGGEE